MAKVDSVLALGHPAERPQTQDFKHSPRYWQDESGTLHVPKRRLESIVHFNRF